MGRAAPVLLLLRERWQGRREAAVRSPARAAAPLLSPLERALKSLSIAYADVLKDSALVEASRQLRAESDLEGRYAALHRQRAEVLAESASWLSEAARQVAERARTESLASAKGN